MHRFHENLGWGSLLECTVKLLASAAAACGAVWVPRWEGLDVLKYLLPCRKAPGQSARCGVPVIENLCMYPLDSCPGFSPKESCLLF